MKKLLLANESSASIVSIISLKAGGDVPIPDFQSIMLPLLELTGDGKELSNKEVIAVFADKWNLTEEERERLLPSKVAKVFANRVMWAKTYIRKAGLITLSGRGIFKITERGLELLENPPQKLTIKHLKQFEEFREFQTINRKGKSTNGKEETLQDNIEEKTPEELLAAGYESIRAALVSDLLDVIHSMTPRFFERLVVDLLLKMGYGDDETRSGIVLGGSGDEGIDGVISEDKLGLDMIYIQAKKWEAGNSVTRPEIQKFVGALQGKRAKKGVFITTANFTNGAKEYADMVETRVILIDGQKLANLMIDHNVGVSLKDSYLIKKIDSDYFEDE